MSRYGGLKWQAGLLAAAGMFEYAMQLILPMILVRQLQPDVFGDYRLLWLLAASSLALFPLFLPQSLFYFLPRQQPSQRGLIVGNAWWFCAATGCAAGGLVWLALPMMSPAMAHLRTYGAVVPVFLALWVLASLADTLPIADGRAAWQAASTVAVALLRTLLLGGVALTVDGFPAVALAMVVFALIKAATVPMYAWTTAMPFAFGFDASLMATQLRYAFPLALSNGLFLMRAQADQWVAASQVSAAGVALVSIGAVGLGFSTLVRQPLNNAVLPRLNQFMVQHDLAGAAALLRKGYTANALVLPAVLGFFIVCAAELIEIVYTPRYLGAAVLMQIYLLGQLGCVLASGHLMGVIHRGAQAVKINAVALALSVFLSALGVIWFGLPGTVAGSVLALWLAEGAALVVVSRALGASVLGLVDLGIIARVGVLVLAGGLLGHWLRVTWMSDWQPWARLLGAGAAYWVAVLPGLAYLAQQAGFMLRRPAAADSAGGPLS